MHRFIDQAISSLSETFHASWEADYKFQEHPESEEATHPYYIEWEIEFNGNSAKFRERISELRSKLFELLNATILSGEYVDTDSFEDQLKKILEILQNIPVSGTAYDKVQTFLNEVLKTNFISCLSEGVGYYLEFLNRLKLRYSIDEKSYVRLIDRDAFGSSYNAYDDTSEKDLYFLYSNINIAEFDHFLTPDGSMLRNLVDEENTIKKGYPENKFCILLLDKCRFLIDKWILRQEESKNDVLYAVSGNRTIELKIENFGHSTIYDKWKDYIESHYNISGKFPVKKISDDISRIKSEKNSLSKQKLIDLHRQIKYYKDVRPDFNNLNSIRIEIKRRWEIASNDPKISRSDKYVMDVIYSYALNNEFSFLLEHQKTDENKITKLYREICSNQLQTRISNFFPHYKYFEYLVNKLRDIFINRRALDYVKASSLIIKNCENVIMEYERNVQWSEKNYNYVFLLPYNESLVKVDNEVVSEVYIASSFVLPISSERYKSNFQEHQRQFYNYKTSIEIFENLERDVKAAEKRELKSIEIIGIFTAIVTFVAASIPTFKFIKDSYQAAIFMFALACSLGIFVLMIIIASRGIHKLKEHLGAVITVGVLAIGGWFALIYFPSDKLNRYVKEKTVVGKIDSLGNKLKEVSDRLESSIGTNSSTHK